MTGGRGEWLLGGLLTELAAVLHTLGAVYMRKACRPAALGESGPPDECLADDLSVAVCKALVRSRAFWGGLALRLLSCGTWWAARSFAPDSTVAPLFLFTSFVANIAAGPALLHEQYHLMEVIVALGCFGTVGLTSIVDERILATSTPNPWNSVLLSDHYCTPKGGLAICIFLWFFCSFVAVIHHPAWRHCSCRSGLDALPGGCLGRQQLHLPRRFPWPSWKTRPAAIPILVGLSSGAVYFVAYAGFSFSAADTGSPAPLLLSSHSAKEWIGWSAAFLLLGGMSIAFSVDGARHFDCRYFIPTSGAAGFSVASVMRVVVLYHRKDAGPLWWVAFVGSHLLLLALPFYFCSTAATITLPRPLKRDFLVDFAMPSQPVLSPLRHGTVDSLPLTTTPLLEFGDERSAGGLLDPAQETGTLALRAPRSRFGRWVFQKYSAVGLALPLLALSVVPLVVLVWRPIGFLALLAPYSLCVVICSGLQTAVFASVGRLRLRLCMATDYQELLVSGRRRQNLRDPKVGGGGRVVVLKDPWDTPDSSSSEEDQPGFWRNVRHFVVVESAPTRNFDLAERRSFLRMIAKSPLAKEQICVFFATPVEGCVGARKGIEELEAEFRGQIWGVQSLQSRSLISEIVSSRLSPNRNRCTSPKKTGVLLQDLLEHVSQSTCTERNVLVTLTTSDSLFQPDHWSALTFAFLSTSRRQTTIWQPPSFPLRDYLGQGPLEKDASLGIALRHLSTFSDPTAVPLPKASYSLPLSLLQAVDGAWESEFDLPVQSTGTWVKCWLTTLGMCSVQPIFMPVLNRAEPGEGRLPWAAVLQECGSGLPGLVYFWAALPLAVFVDGWAKTKSTPASVSANRLLCLIVRSMLPLIGLALHHVSVSTHFGAVGLTTTFLLYGLLFWPSSDIDTKTFLVAMTAALLGLITSVLFGQSHVALLELLATEDESDCDVLSQEEIGNDAAKVIREANAAHNRGGAGRPRSPHLFAEDMDLIADSDLEQVHTTRRWGSRLLVPRRASAPHLLSRSCALSSAGPGPGPGLPRLIFFLRSTCSQAVLLIMGALAEWWTAVQLLSLCGVCCDDRGRNAFQSFRFGRSDDRLIC